MGLEAFFVLIKSAESLNSGSIMMVSITNRMPAVNILHMLVILNDRSALKWHLRSSNDDGFRIIFDRI